MPARPSICSAILPQERIERGIFLCFSPDVATLLLTIRKFNIPSLLSEIFFIIIWAARHFDVTSSKYILSLYFHLIAYYVSHEFLREIFLTGKIRRNTRNAVKISWHKKRVKENDIIFKIITIFLLFNKIYEIMYIIYIYVFFY